MTSTKQRLTGASADLAARLAARRRMLGLTQEALAERCTADLNRSAIAGIEARLRKIDVDELDALFSALDLPSPLPALLGDGPVLPQRRTFRVTVEEVPNG